MNNIKLDKVDLRYLICAAPSVADGDWTLDTVREVCGILNQYACINDTILKLSEEELKFVIDSVNAVIDCHTKEYKTLKELNNGVYDDDSDVIDWLMNDITDTLMKDNLMQELMK